MRRGLALILINEAYDILTISQNTENRQQILLWFFSALESLPWLGNMNHGTKAYHAIKKDLTKNLLL